MLFCRSSWANRRCYWSRCSSVLLCQRLLPFPICWQRGFAWACTYAFGSGSVSRAGAIWPCGWCELTPGIWLLWIRECSYGLLSVADPVQGQGEGLASAPTAQGGGGGAGGGQPSEADGTLRGRASSWKMNAEEVRSCEFTPLSLCVNFVTLRGRWLDCCMSLSVNNDTHLFWKLSVTLCTGLDYHCLSPWLSGVCFTEAQMLPRKFQNHRIASYFLCFLLHLDISPKDAMPSSISFWTGSPFVMSWCFFSFFNLKACFGVVSPSVTVSPQELFCFYIICTSVFCLWCENQQNAGC